MTRSNSYIALYTTLSHTAIYFLRGKSIDQAIENFFCDWAPPPRKFKNGRWRWGKEYFSSSHEVLASLLGISFEIRLLPPREKGKCQEVFAGIDWLELIYNWAGPDFYMKNKTRVGRFYEWSDPTGKYYALFPSPRTLKRKLKHELDLFSRVSPPPNKRL
jgi:hypothetical protein